MSAIRKLAGQTAVYGVSTIMGRLLNFALVPLFSYIFGEPQELGLNTEFYAYIAFLNVVFTFGMETALFNFLSSEENKPMVYSTALRTMLVSTVVLTIPFIFLSQTLANLMRYPDHPEFITWSILIVATDALMALPFAKLREENKAKRFAAIKLLYILVNIVVTLFFVGLCKHYHDLDPSSFWGSMYNPEIGIGYAFIANLVASSVCLLLLSKEYLKIRLGFDAHLLRRMLVYALPLLVVGLAGMTNEVLDKILLKYLLPPGIGEAQVGIYGTCYKIAILMTIFWQAFRYAAEPFFFSRQKEENSREMYSTVMTYFVVFCLAIFLGTTMNLSWIQYMIGESYRGGMEVVPILLFANMCLGIYFNLSIWYKLTARTQFGMWLTLAGAIVTLTLNFIWIPSTGYFAGYMGSAWATLICYTLMMILSYFIGQKYFPVPYQTARILGYIGLALALYFAGKYTSTGSDAADLVFRNLIFGLFVTIVVLVEKPFKVLRSRKK
ncbi:MAG TPA: oligosaccharide flippase family protein [Bacteroidia bacterium]|nr:oligosaccharide flippase family protein [Bacteroidia bacterium]